MKLTAFWYQYGVEYALNEKREKQNFWGGTDGNTGGQAVAEESVEMQNAIKRNTVLNHKEDTTAVTGQAKKWLRRPPQKTEESYGL